LFEDTSLAEKIRQGSEYGDSEHQYFNDGIYSMVMLQQAGLFAVQANFDALYKDPNKEKIWVSIPST